MKRVGAAVAFAAVAVAVFVWLGATRNVSSAPQPVVTRSDDRQSARLQAQIEELQRSLVAVKSQLASQQRQLPAPRAVSPGDAQPPEPESVEAQRAADAERRRTYMAGVAQAFANEKVDPAWASRVSARVGATFEGDEMLRNIAHSVECRQQTCRVQIDDDASGRLSGRMPFLALGLADVLPQVSAEHIEQANGHGAMVLYMSSQREASLPGLR